MQILASLVEGLDICSADVFIRVGIGLKGSIGVVFLVGAGGSIVDSLTVQQRFLLNNTDIIKADMLINYKASAAD